MPNTIYETQNIASPVIVPIIFILETSQSQESLEWMNQMMEGTIHYLKQYNDHHDYEIRIGILDSGITRITGNALIPIKNYSWHNLSLAPKGFVKDIAAELTKSMSETKLFNFNEGNSFLRPSIFILTNGKDTDKDIYFDANINNLWQNKIYQSANRFIICNEDYVKEEIYVNLIGEGTYLDITDLNEPIINELITDLVNNTLNNKTVDIASKYQDIVEIRNIQFEI